MTPSSPVDPVLLIALDFDGVLARHAPTPPVENPNPPVPGALEFVNWLIKKGYAVCVFSVRAGFDGGLDGIVRWLERNAFPPLPVTDTKPNAALFVDDRGYRFDGDFVKLGMFFNNHPRPGRWEQVANG